MPRLRTCFAACLLVLLLGGAAPASAKIVEVGQSATPAQPACPGDPCFALSRTTGYQAKVGETRGLFAVPEDGRIVAWSISLSAPSKEQMTSFERRFGGAPSAGITILRPGRKSYARTLVSSPVERLVPYLGETVQFPLEQSLPVRKGSVVALTVPTWAPALAVGLG